MIKFKGSIRQIGIDEIENLSEIAQSFFSESKFLQDFDMSIFATCWTQFISSEIGVVFVCEEDGKFVGTLGGFKFPDPCNGKLMATEMFWFVLPEYRGRGKELLVEFEDWAKENKCERIIMVHLKDVMPEIVKNIYIKKGYIEMETHYIKEVI